MGESPTPVRMAVPGSYSEGRDSREDGGRSRGGQQADESPSSKHAGRNHGELKPPQVKVVKAPKSTIPKADLAKRWGRSTLSRYQYSRTGWDRFGGVKTAACVEGTVCKASDHPTNWAAEPTAGTQRGKRVGGVREAHSSDEAGQLRWSERALVKAASKEIEVHGQSRLAKAWNVNS